MAPYEALYGRRCRSPVDWFDSGEARLLGTDLVQDALDKVKVIQERLRTAQSRQKSYANKKVRDVSYMIGEKVLLKVSPMKGVMRFGKKVNRNKEPRDVDPKEIKDMLKCLLKQNNEKQVQIESQEATIHKLEAQLSQVVGAFNAQQANIEDSSQEEHEFEVLMGRSE
ncbi:uncharacterized protein [Nicotiana sylvestris]|uniref:uncharacterized protein n=1 Tax=Nicotiana sylvestris TaxID=4096 RepID=UPI00388C9581